MDRVRGLLQAGTSRGLAGRVGLVLGGTHLLAWGVLLAMRLALGSAGSLDWNPFQVATFWHDAYGLVNAPVYLAYEPIDSYFVREERLGTRDVVPPSLLERAASYSFHLAGFALWWYCLGVAAAAILLRLRRRLGQ